MEMVIKATVINIEDIMAIEGEEIQFELPKYNVLPVGVLDMDGNLLGYLGRNDATCVPGTTTGQDFCKLLESGWELSNATVERSTYYRTQHRKVILEIKLTLVQEQVYI